MARRIVLGEGAARKLRELFNGRGVSGSVRRSDADLTFEDSFAHPFAVQWAQSANDGEGSWVIWLPSDDLVTIPEGSLDPSAELDEAEGDYPEGWYVLTDSMLDRTTGGTLYLNVSLGDSQSAVFSDAPAAATGDEFDVPICTASVNSTTGERVVRQFVTSAIIVGGGGDGGSKLYGCDERSITLVDYQGSDSEGLPGDYFYLSGFGRFTFDSNPLNVHGFYSPPTEAEIALDGDATSFAVLCRTGNTTTPNGNYLGYRKLRLVGSAGSSPFKYEKSTTSSGGSTVTTHKLVNCCFYWNGEMKTLADFDVSGILGGGSVYLRGKQEAPSASDADPTWTWTLGTSEEEEPTGGKVLNFKLYDFAQSKVAVDYRTTFLALADHTQKAKFTVSKPDGDASIVLDASGEKPKLVITDGTNTISIDLADVDSECGGAFAIHELKYKDKNGTEKTCHGLFCEDVDLTGTGKTIKDVKVTPSANEQVVLFTYSDGTTSEIHIPHGLPGDPGHDGNDGDTPEITADTNNGVTHIYADGDLIATVLDGHTPSITASKNGGVTTIYADGQAIATIADGSGGSAELPDKNVVTGVSFAISGGKLVATISKENLKTGATSQSSSDVCDVSELDVVVSEAYSTSTHQFTNERKKIQVIGSPTASQGQTPFTATPLSSE